MRRKGLYCRSIAINGLFDFISQKGGHPTAWANEVGINPNFKSSNIEFLSWNGICDLLEICAVRLDAPSFGIEWAHALPKNLSNSGPTLLIALATKNIRETLNLCIDYQKLHTNGVLYGYAEDEAKAEVTGYVDIHPLSRPSRQYCEHIMAYIAIHGHKYNSDLKFKQVTFQHKAPADQTWHDRTFKTQILFDSSRNTLVTDLAILDTSHSFILKILTPFLRSYLRRQKRALTHNSSVTLDVAELLPNAFGIRRSRVTDIAAAMGMSEKKLQRLLREEGTSYSEILSDVRQNCATRLLIESEMSITHIAKILDYASVESFNMACKRWYALSPRQVRQRG